MEIAGPYRIDGVEFSHETLIRHCMELVGKAGRPDWYMKVFAFIQLFLDESTGPILQKTSGTTGDPKEFQLSRKAMRASARKSLSFFNLQPGDRALLCLPVDYIAGKMMVVRALVGGMDLVLTEPSGRPLQGVEGEFDFAAMVPLQVHDSLNEDDELNRIETLLIGGGELHPSIREKLTRLNTPNVFESFAMTETYTHFALRQLNGPAPDSQFWLLDGVKIEKDDRDCLVVEMPGVTEGKVVTNDLVEISDDGSGFLWLGRIDNVINTGGIKVIPELLEAKIKGLIGMECLVLSLEDDKLGQKLVLLVENSDANPPVAYWEELMKKQLSSYEIPKKTIVTREISRNAAFKPDRVASLRLIDS
jgi:O-succinylbenzoic acid--CoA ligase